MGSVRLRELCVYTIAPTPTPPLKGKGLLFCCFRVTVSQALRHATAQLVGTSTTPRLDAELLMADALGVSRSDMLLRHGDATVPHGFDAQIARRMAGEPLAYILGHAEFYGLELMVSPAVLIPRADSETLIEAARLALQNHPPQRILDLGTGSGALVLAALSIWQEAKGIGVERCDAARHVAMRNAARHGGGRAQMIAGDWTQTGWADHLGQFDLILANPPYVELDDADLAQDVRRYEPDAALFAGADGLDDYRILIPALPQLLAPQGVAIVEIGWKQAEAVIALGQAVEMHAILHPDLAGRPRALQFFV